MLPLLLLLPYLLSAAVASPCAPPNSCVSALRALPKLGPSFCTSLLHNLPTSTSTTTIKCTSTSTRTEHVTSAGPAPGRVTTTKTVYVGATTTVTVDVTNVAAPTAVVLTTLIEKFPGSTVTRVVTTTLASQQTLPATVVETLVESSTVTLIQTSVSTIFESEISTSTVSSTAQTETATNLLTATVSDVSSTTLYGATVTTDVPIATVTTTALDISTFTQIITSTVVATEFAATQTLTSFTSTAVTFVATSTTTITLNTPPVSPSTVVLLKRRLSASFPYNFPGCNANAAAQACKLMGLWPKLHHSPHVLRTIRVVVVVQKNIRVVIYLHGGKAQTTTVTRTVTNSGTATTTRTHAVTSAVMATSTVRSSSTLLGATLSSTLFVPDVQTVSKTATSMIRSIAIRTTETTVTVSTLVPTTVVSTSIVLVTVTTTIDKTLTATAFATATIDSADATKTITVYVTATDSATLSSVTTASSTSAFFFTTSLSSTTIQNAVAVASSTLVTSCQLGQSLPTPNAVINGGFEFDLDAQPWTYSVRSGQASYTGSLTMETSVPAPGGCRSGAINVDVFRTGIVTASAGLWQTISTTPGKTYQFGFSYRALLPSGMTLATMQLSASVSSENLPTLLPLGDGTWKSYSTPFVAFSDTTSITFSFYQVSATVQGKYSILLDEVFVTEVNDNPNLLINGGFDSSPNDPAPWTGEGDGTFALQSTGLVWSPPNVGAMTFSVTQASAPPSYTIRQSVVSGLVPGVKYKCKISYNILATYTLPAGSSGNGQNGVRIGVEYPDAPQNRTVVVLSGVGPYGGGTFAGSFTALYESAVWFADGWTTFTIKPAGSTLVGNVVISVDNLYLVRDTTVRT